MNGRSLQGSPEDRRSNPRPACRTGRDCFDIRGRRLAMTVFVAALFMAVYPSPPAYALSVRHHLYNMGRNLVQVVWSPIEGALVNGPRQIKETYHYEVHGREQPEKRGLLRYRLFALWRAPADEMKAVIDGTVKSVESAGGFLKEFLSIFFSD